MRKIKAVAAVFYLVSSIATLAAQQMPHGTALCRDTALFLSKAGLKINYEDIVYGSTNDFPRNITATLPATKKKQVNRKICVTFSSLHSQWKTRTDTAHLLKHFSMK